MSECRLAHRLVVARRMNLVSDWSKPTARHAARRCLWRSAAEVATRVEHAVQGARRKPRPTWSVGFHPTCPSDRGCSEAVQAGGGGRAGPTWGERRKPRAQVRPPGVACSPASRVSLLSAPARLRFAPVRRYRPFQPDSACRRLPTAPVAPLLGQKTRHLPTATAQPSRPPGQSLPSRVLPLACQTTRPTLMRTRASRPA
jgi:hypothetical protein